MANDNKERLKHILLGGFCQSGRFSRAGGGGNGQRPPKQNRQTHGGRLLQRLANLEPRMQRNKRAQEDAGLETGFGLQIEFESFPDIELAFESLADHRQKIELLNFRHHGDTTMATVFIPEGKLAHFERLITDYINERRDRSGKPRDNSRLFNTIRDIRAATLQALWTDTGQFPDDDLEKERWWEIWLSARGDRQSVLDQFRHQAELMDIRVAEGHLEFPERTVVLARTSAATLGRSMIVLNSIAELRKAKETAEFFDEMPLPEQEEWAEELLERTRFTDADDAPRLCVLDTGVNRGHPLLAPAMAPHDSHTVEPGWGQDDSHGHGTGMAGLALYGNLTEALDTQEPITLSHRLESVKLIPHDGANAHDSGHHGYLTREAVSRPEITSPWAPRIFSMAITARDNRDRGRPSAWSAALDALTSDSEGDGENSRLMVVAAGNVNDPDAWGEYPGSNSTDGIHDPAQAWNAVTVGAYTELVTTETTESAAIAEAGSLSPFSTTSLKWRSDWPLKPDIVCEGGNVADGALGPATMQSLNLLTTHRSPTERLFTTTNATSAATSLAARMAARIMATYPAIWPETVRGLLVHSATWTTAMKALYLPEKGEPKKSDYVHLVRHCGFGVPDLEEAMWSAANSLTLMAQESLTPFIKEHGRIKTRDMNLHELPWPEQELLDLGETPVEMRVTLSYFIQPNPSARGIRSRYRYESHGLRFDVKRPLESDGDFIRRINTAAREEDDNTKDNPSDKGWLIGPNSRHRGSIHSDIWRGTAAELASRGALAVYPTAGWWRTRPAQQRHDSEARYGLLISIHAPDADVDLYTAVDNLVALSVST